MSQSKFHQSNKTIRFTPSVLSCYCYKILRTVLQEDVAPPMWSSLRRSPVHILTTRAIPCWHIWRGTNASSLIDQFETQANRTALTSVNKQITVKSNGTVVSRLNRNSRGFANKPCSVGESVASVRTIPSWNMLWNTLCFLMCNSLLRHGV